MAALLVFLLGAGGNLAISQVEGAALFVLMLADAGFLLWQSRREHNAAVEAEYAQEYTSHEPKGVGRNLINGVLVVVGLACCLY